MTAAQPDSTLAWRLQALDIRARCAKLAADLPGSAVATGLGDARDVIDLLLQRYDRLASRVQRDLDAHSARVRDGMARAARTGKHVGRPRLEAQDAPSPWRDGLSLQGVARTLGISRSTVRRRLLGAGIDPTARGRSSTREGA